MLFAAAAVPPDPRRASKRCRELLELRRSDLLANLDDVINWQAGNLCVSAASIGIRRTKFAEGMLSVRSDMAANPLHAIDLLAGSDNFPADFVELILR
jgi:hypothetical protein